MHHRPSPFQIQPIATDLIVWSHLRWDFVFQRPQHLLSRFAKHRRVFFFEEPNFCETSFPKLNYKIRDNGVVVVTPDLKQGLTDSEVLSTLKLLVDEMIEREEIERFTSWYYTPMALQFTHHLNAETTIYDAMDELSAFKGASPLLIHLEKDLLKLADVVFTGGQSLYEAKRHQHRNVHCFPSSIDRAHFARARDRQNSDPVDQASIPHPRIGFFGVVDERFDIELLRAAAALRTDWHFVVIGPVVKISEADLPRSENIHYLGMKSYQELPAYLSGWDLAILPFARNESTRYISPTKTPEYLAAGCPVVSTSIRDVVSPYGELGLVEIANLPEDFIAACEVAMKKKQDAQWEMRVNEFLSDKSWDQTSKAMMSLENSLRKHEKHPGLTQPRLMQRAVYGTELEA